MIQTKQELKDVLALEKAQYRLGLSQVLLGKLGLSEKGMIWNYQKSLRKYEYHRSAHHRMRAAFYHFRSNRLGFRYGMMIEPGAVDAGMRICHLGSIIIRGHIGKNAVIHINTALVGGGSVDIPPTCGDNLYLSIGSTIVGNVHVGDDVCIAAGAVVTHNVESHTTVGGVPAKVIANEGPSSWGNR